MDKYMAAEQAYKKGYEDGKRDAVKHGKWIVRHRHEHYPSGMPYDEDVCPYCKRADHNGDGLFCGYCGAKMDLEEEDDG